MADTVECFKSNTFHDLFTFRKMNILTNKKCVKWSVKELNLHKKKVSMAAKKVYY